MNRYQHQRLPVKLYRWLRWKPWYAAKAVRATIRHGYLPEIWSLHMALADCKMNHLYTMEEVLNDTTTTSS
jgi:hypothetical protein